MIIYIISDKYGGQNLLWIRMNNHKSYIHAYHQNPSEILETFWLKIKVRLFMFLLRLKKNHFCLEFILAKK